MAPHGIWCWSTHHKDDQKCSELRIATYVACYTSVSAVDDLSDIIQDEVGAFRMHRTKCTSVIKSVQAPHFREELREEIGKNETTDISVNKFECISVKTKG